MPDALSIRTGNSGSTSFRPVILSRTPHPQARRPRDPVDRPVGLKLAFDQIGALVAFSTLTRLLSSMADESLASELFIARQLVPHTVRE